MNLVYRFITFITVFLILEFVANFFIFPLLNRYFNIGQSKEEKYVEPQIGPRLKGILERFCVAMALSLGFESILAAFGALKIGTRLKGKEINNDYFLFGNLLSILIALFEYYASSKIYELTLSDFQGLFG